MLYPHFEPSSVKYASYRFLGPTDLLFEPWVLLPGLLVSIIPWWILKWRGWQLGLLLAAVLVLAHLVVHIRLRNTVERFLSASESNILRGRFHIIAHSLGSYIVCTALQDEETMRARRIVLAGCVVNVCFPWRAVFAAKKCAAVRNEVAGRDVVAWAARLLRWRFARFGSAGYRGFTVTEDFVHTISSPNERCSVRPDAAPVHNVVSPMKGHSGVLRSTYVKYYWLPFFWGFEPCEYVEWLDACSEMMGAIIAAGGNGAPAAGGDFDTRAAAFLRRRWSWAGGSTIRRYLENLERPVASGDERIIAFNVCVAVVSAEEALGAKIDEWRNNPVARRSFKSAVYDDAITALNPRIAVLRAYEAYLNSGINDRL